MEMGLKVIVWPILGHYFFYYILVNFKFLGSKSDMALGIDG